MCWVDSCTSTTIIYSQETSVATGSTLQPRPGLRKLSQTFWVLVKVPVWESKASNTHNKWSWYRFQTLQPQEVTLLTWRSNWRETMKKINTSSASSKLNAHSSLTTNFGQSLKRTKTKKKKRNRFLLCYRWRWNLSWEICTIFLWRGFQLRLILNQRYSLISNHWINWPKMRSWSRRSTARWTTGYASRLRMRCLMMVTSGRWLNNQRAHMKEKVTILLNVGMSRIRSKMSIG